MKYCLSLLFGCFLSITGCASNSQTIANTPKPAKEEVSNQISYPNFDAWKTAFTAKAVTKGYNQADVQRLLADTYFHQATVSQDKNQSEFNKFAWQYAENMLNPVRIQAGEKAYLSNKLLISQLSDVYSVSPAVLMGIWGVESNFGANTGKASLANSLATLAYEGRRRDFAENQLFALLELLENGDIAWGQLYGSWAGGMGQTQFIPTTFLNYGVDGDGDGHRNPWDIADALASTANYLSQSGWIKGLPWGAEVNLAQDFHFELAGNTLSYREWLANDISLTQTQLSLPLDAEFQLWLPAGKEGTAFLLSKNFEVVQVYNHSMSYALGVFLLGDAIVGNYLPQMQWPDNEIPLSREQAKQLQQQLTDLGFDTYGIDGILGKKTQSAFQKWQQSNALVPDGFISQRTASQLLTDG